MAVVVGKFSHRVALAVSVEAESEFRVIPQQFRLAGAPKRSVFECNHHRLRRDHEDVHELHAPR